MYKSAVLPENKDVKMGAAKITAILAGLLNVFIYVFAWVANLDNIKSTILFIVALLMSMYRFYRWAITSLQNKRLKDLAIQEKELELRERRIGIDKKEAQHYRDEFSIAITGLTEEQRKNQEEKNKNK